MKILSIVWYKVLPAVYGGQKGIAHFNKQLASKFELVCLCSKNNRAEVQLPYRIINKLPVGKWQFLNPFNLAFIQRIIKKERPSLIILEHPYYGLLLSRKKKNNIPFIIHAHNIESLRFQMLGRAWWWFIKLFEHWVFSKADLILFKTVEEKAYAIREFGIGDNKAMVFPYCVERPTLAGHQSNIRDNYSLPGNEKILLFAGSLDYKPNYEAINNIVQKLIPLLNKKGINYRVIVCGKIPGNAIVPTDPRILYAGEVEDLTDHYIAADVFINPVLTSTGIQTKMIDSIAHNCNTVCFQGLTGIELMEAAGNKLFPAKDNDWNSFASSVIHALESPAVPTPESFFEKYGWDLNLRLLENRLSSPDFPFTLHQSL